jgi:hypothetical protein
MAKLLFDPRTYQFYFPAGSGNRAAQAAGFAWDPFRLRYYTEDPKVAVRLAAAGDSYVKRLLAEALDTASRAPMRTLGSISASLPSTSIH